MRARIRGGLHSAVIVGSLMVICWNSCAELRAASLQAAAPADSAPHAAAPQADPAAGSAADNVTDVADTLIREFRSRKPAAWRKLIGFSKRWSDLAEPVFDRHVASPLMMAS